jgi:hypothetical protein
VRTPAALSVSVSLRASLRNTHLQVQWYESSTRTWKALTTAEIGLDAGRLDVDHAAPTRAVGPDGKVRLRLVAGNGRPFDLVIDQIEVTAVTKR